MEFMQWLIPHCGSVHRGRPCARSTWRQYRAAVRWRLSRDRPPGWQAALELLDQQAPLGLAPRASRQPGRARRVDPMRLHRLIAAMQALDYRRAPIAHLVHLWWHAGRVTGLRPCEWCGARLERPAGPEDQLWLVVPCAKITNGRGCAAHRRLDLSGLRPEHRQAVLAWLRHASTLRPDAFRTLQRRAARLVRRANAAICRDGERRITLPRGACPTRIRSLTSKLPCRQI